MPWLACLYAPCRTDVTAAVHIQKRRRSYGFQRKGCKEWRDRCSLIRSLRKELLSGTMSVFSANINHRSFHWQINILCFVLGLVLACAFFTANQIARQGTISPRAGFVYGNSGLAPDKTKDFEKEIQQLQAEKTALSDKV